MVIAIPLPLPDLVSRTVCPALNSLKRIQKSMVNPPCSSEGMDGMVSVEPLRN